MKIYVQKNEDDQSVANYLVVEEAAKIYCCCLKKGHSPTTTTVKKYIEQKDKKGKCVYFLIELKYLIRKFSWGNVELVEGFRVLF